MISFYVDNQSRLFESVGRVGLREVTSGLRTEKKLSAAAGILTKITNPEMIESRDAKKAQYISSTLKVNSGEMEYF